MNIWEVRAILKYMEAKQAGQWVFIFEYGGVHHHHRIISDEDLSRFISVLYCLHNRQA